MEAYGADYISTMKSFGDLTNTEAYGWEVGYTRYDFRFKFKYNDPIYCHPTDYDKDIYPNNLCGKLLFRYINNNIMPRIIKGRYFSTPCKYVDGKYEYKHKYSRVMFDYGDNFPLTGMCYDLYLLKPIIDGNYIPVYIHNLQSIMNGENIIPKITDKRGMSWNQPHRRYIEIDEEYALMTKQTFEGLREYSLTIPSGKYEGKMWKANRGGTWYLYWYDHDDNPEMIKIERREILLLN